MPTTLPDLADLIKLNDQALSTRLANDLRQAAPFLFALPAEFASNGTVHAWLARTGAPTVGFRAINDGLAKSPSEQTKKTATLVYLDASTQSDVAYGDGFDSRVYGTGPMAYVQKESEEAMAAAMFAYESQVINGTVEGDAAGFTGLADTLADIGAKVINAGDANAGIVTSAYLVRAAMDELYVVTGNQGRFNVKPTVITTVAGGNSETHGSYYTDAGGYMGVAIASVESAVRIGNIATTPGAATMTDDLFYQARALFPANRPPTHMVYNNTVWEQHRSSRTATNITGQPATLPETLAGVEIIVSDAITNTETVLT